MFSHILCLVVLLFVAIANCAVAQIVHDENGERIATPRRWSNPGHDIDFDKAVSVVIDRTNDFRKENGRQPVARNARLMETAKYFADYMAKTNKYGHEADGKRPADRAAGHGYDYCIVLENIAYQYNSAGFTTQELADSFFEGWKHSPGHRKNMLDPDVTETGVAIARSDETGYYYAVQMFGRPKSQSVEFEITNQAASTVKYRVGERAFELPPGYTRTHQQCRPSESAIAVAGQTLQPRDGERLVISSEGGKLKVSR